MYTKITFNQNHYITKHLATGLKTLASQKSWNFVLIGCQLPFEIAASKLSLAAISNISGSQSNTLETKIPRFLLCFSKVFDPGS